MNTWSGPHQGPRKAILIFPGLTTGPVVVQREALMYSMCWQVLHSGCHCPLLGAELHRRELVESTAESHKSGNFFCGAGRFQFHGRGAPWVGSKVSVFADFIGWESLRV